MASASKSEELSFDFKVNNITMIGAEEVSVSFTLPAPLQGGLPPAGLVSPSSTNLVLNKEDARGIFPGDVYTVTFKKKA